MPRARAFPGAFAAFVCATLALARPSRAEEHRASKSATVLSREQRRDPAEYRGRGRQTDAADVLAWFPRILFYPVYLLLEPFVRWPAYEAAAFIDRHHVVPIVDRIFHPTPTFYWHPTFAFDLGVYGSVGATGTWRDALVRGHTVRASFATGGVDTWEARIRDELRVGPARFGVYGSFFERNDRAFFGLGPDSGGPRTWFTLGRYDALAFLGLGDGDHARIEASEGVRFESTEGGRDPSIETVFDTSTIPGYGQSYALARSSLDVRLDSRASETATGARFVASASYARDVRRPDVSFAQTSVELEGSIEAMHPGRTLAFRFYGSNVFRLGTEPVPFEELSMLGWRNHYGFEWGRFRDEAAVLAETSWRYPIAYLIDMTWIASVGNVFAHDFHDFDVRQLTGSLAVGFRTRGTGRVPIELLFAAGTTRFDQPFGIDSFRVYLATTDDL
jgi:hypothetical protein